MTNAIRAPFPWFGGKAGHKIKDAILSALPPHKRYLEPFGGGASILIAKQPAEVEVYNDVNRGVVNFFRVISDVDYFGKFMARAALLPVSRELYEEYSRTWTGIPRSPRAGGALVLHRAPELRRDVRPQLGHGGQFIMCRDVVSDVAVDQQL